MKARKLEIDTYYQSRFMHAHFDCACGSQFCKTVIKRGQEYLLFAPRANVRLYICRCCAGRRVGKQALLLYDCADTRARAGLDQRVI